MAGPKREIPPPAVRAIAEALYWLQTKRRKIDEWRDPLGYRFGGGGHLLPTPQLGDFGEHYYDLGRGERPPWGAFVGPRDPETGFSDLGTAGTPGTRDRPQEFDEGVELMKALGLVTPKDI